LTRADRQHGGDDRGVAGSGDIVKVIGKTEICFPALRSKQVFDSLQHFERQDTSEAAAVDGEQLLRACALDPLYQAHGLTSRLTIALIEPEL
jgi:hypothetical protein